MLDLIGQFKPSLPPVLGAHEEHSGSAAEYAQSQLGHHHLGRPTPDQ